MNFTISGALSSLEYRWYLDNKEVYRGKNPNAWKLSRGKHTLTLETYRKGATVLSSKQEYIISVISTAKKTKKIPKKSKPKKTTIHLNPIPNTQASNGVEAQQNDSPILAIFILIAGLGFGFLLRGRKKPNHSS